MYLMGKGLLPWQLGLNRKVVPRKVKMERLLNNNNNNNTNNIPLKYIKKLQKTAMLGTAHILRNY
jgi:hypothetical protein